MEFLRSNWLYFVSAGLMAYMMFRRGGCCGGHSTHSHSHDGNSQGGGCCSTKENSDHSSDSHDHEKKLI